MLFQTPSICLQSHLYNSVGQLYHALHLKNMDLQVASPQTYFSKLYYVEVEWFGDAGCVKLTVQLFGLSRYRLSSDTVDIRHLREVKGGSLPCLSDLNKAAMLDFEMSLLWQGPVSGLILCDRSDRSSERNDGLHVIMASFVLHLAPHAAQSMHRIMPIAF